MGLSIGIVGLPNVGKSTTFNALTKTQNAQAANYPFCTIEPNKAIVDLKDYRLKEISKIVNPKRIEYSKVEFVDIAGLVSGASKGEGLGNEFLANIRECECILHMIRCFDDENIIHVESGINPVRDAEIIELELIYSDITSLSKRISKLEKNLKASKDSKKELELALDLMKLLESFCPIRSYEFKNTPEFINLNREIRFLSNKEMIYGANVNEDALLNGNEYIENLKKYVSKNNSEVITLCSKLEEDLIDMSDYEREQFLNDMNIKSSLDEIIKIGYEKLGLISYFTAGVQEVRSWSIKKGFLAPKAASVIHNDFEKGFIRAECISYDDFIKYNGEQGAKEAGVLRVEGKDYEVKDGDILHFRFNI